MTGGKGCGDGALWYIGGMPMLWARTVTFESVSPGDRLPIVIKWETEEAIRRSNAADDAAEEDDDGLEEGEEFLNPAVIRGYAEELLLRAFPPESVEDPARRLELEVTGNIASSDTVSLSGVVVGKRAEDGRGMVECELVVEKQGADLTLEVIGTGVAVVPLGL